MNKSQLLVTGSVSILLLAMINACTKDMGKAPVATTPPPTVSACDTITYTKHIKAIVDANCVSCHNAGTQSGGVSLTNYTEVKDRADAGRIKARAIDGNPSFMPVGGQLSADQKNLINCWLENGKKQ